MSETKRERRVRKALARSLRNQPPLQPNARMKRHQRRLAARLAQKPAETAPVQPAAPQTPLSDLTVPALKVLARERGVEGYSKLKKDDLIAALS